MIDCGHGSPIVLIPGVQGRWEWMKPTVTTLAGRHRVLSFSLDEVTDDGDPARAFDAWVAYIDRVLDDAHERRAAIGGVSFGSLVALYYAARRPDRCTALVLVSPPAPRWRWDHPSAKYVTHPIVRLPGFVVSAIRRLLPEVYALGTSRVTQLRFLATHFLRVLQYPSAPSRMASRVHAWNVTDLVAEIHRITAPTLIVTGERELDRVVPQADSLEYLSRIPGAGHVTLEHTGHLGVITRPERLAELVSIFLATAPAARVGKAG